MKPTALTRRARRLLPLAAVLLGAAAANLLTAGSAAAFSNCSSDSFASAAATGGTSPPCESFGRGSASLLDIRQGDFSEITVTASDPNASLFLKVNEDPPITCTYHNGIYHGLSGDQYNVIVNGGSTVNEPTLDITLSTAVAGLLRGAQQTIALGQAQVCFGSPRPFTTKVGSTLTFTNDPGIGRQYVGLLPDCPTPAQRRAPGPCITGRTATQLPTPTGPTGVVNVFIVVPPGFDPRLHG